MKRRTIVDLVHRWQGGRQEAPPVLGLLETSGSSVSFDPDGQDAGEGGRDDGTAAGPYTPPPQPGQLAKDDQPAEDGPLQPPGEEEPMIAPSAPMMDAPPHPALDSRRDGRLSRHLEDISRSIRLLQRNVGGHGRGLRRGGRPEEGGVGRLYPRTHALGDLAPLP